MFSQAVVTVSLKAAGVSWGRQSGQEEGLRPPSWWLFFFPGLGPAEPAISCI